MIPVNAIWIFSLVGVGAISIILFCMILFNSSIRGKEFSLLRHFPFEFGRLNPRIYSSFKSLIFVLSGFSFTPLFVITPLFNDFGGLGFLCILVTCVFGLAAISNCFLFFFDARFTKAHIVLVTVSMCLTLLANALSTLISILVFKSYLDMSEYKITTLILAVLSGILTLCMLFLILNPKLTSWSKLEVNIDKNGEKSVSRGKIFVLATSEWITIVISVIGEILFLLTLIR